MCSYLKPTSNFLKQHKNALDNMTRVFLYIRTSNLFHKKCSQKCSHSVDFYCNTLNFENSRIALNQGFFVSTET